MRLPDPRRSQAILIGVSTYQSAELPDVPAVRNNVDGLAAALTAPGIGGFAATCCTVLADPSSVRLTYRAIRDYADRTEDTLLVYFAGHGLTGTRRGELYLGLADTEPNELPVSALSFNLIREVFLDCPAANRVLILDCCFSGRATQDFLAAPRDAILGEVEIAGTYTIASAPPNALALAQPGARYTAFTGELLSLLNKGIPDGPELLSLGTTYRHLRRTMTAKGLPLPGQRGTDSADLLALTRNPAYRDSRDDDESPAVATPSPPSRFRFGISRRLTFVSAIVVIVTVAVVTVILRNSQSHDPAGSSPPSETRESTSTNHSPTTTVTITTTVTTTIAAPPPEVVRQVPIRVFNNSTIARIASQAADDFRADGWNIVEVANYSQSSIPTTTVYFRPGTEEEAAARAFAAKFFMRAEARFQGIANAEPGLIVVIQKDYGGA